MILTQFQLPIKRVRSDGGGEFQSLRSFFDSKGIIHELSCPYTPQQNGRVERKNRHVVETGLSLLAHSSLPKSFWPYAFATAVYLINRLPSAVLGFLSPFQCLYSKSPDYSLLRVFGCLCFPFIRPYNDHKLEFRSLPCVFLGYSSKHKGFLCYHVPTSRIYITRHTIFNERSFPFATPPPSSPPPSSHVSLPSFHIPSSSPTSPSDSAPNPSSLPNALSPDLSPSFPVLSPSSSASSPNPSSVLPVSDSSSSLAPISSHVSASPSLPSSNSRLQSSHPMITRAKAGIFKPKTFFTIAPTTPCEPSSYSEASKSSNWLAAMETEFGALMQQGTWTLVPLPPGSKAIGCKWVYRLKLRPDGSVDRYKARLVAKGFHQVEGLDFTDTFSPVI